MPSVKVSTDHEKNMKPNNDSPKNNYPKYDHPINSPDPKDWIHLCCV